jgi:TonB family protein
MKHYYHKTLLFFSLILLLTTFSFAQTERDKGIELYRQGRDLEAIRLLQQAVKQKAAKNDAEVWNYLGLAYVNQNKTKEGRKALEKAVKLAPENSIYRSNLAYVHLLTRKVDKAQSEVSKAIQLDPNNANAFYVSGIANLWENEYEKALSDAERTIAINPRFTVACIFKSDAFMSAFGKVWMEESNPRENLNLLEQAADSLEKCLSGCPKDNNLALVADRIETVKAFLDYFKRSEKTSTDQAVSATDNRTPLNITFKAKPSYTDAARQANEEGDIHAAVLFGSDGKIKYVLILKGLRYGLNEQAVKAARLMKFEPQTENGKPISVVKRVVFSFDIY